MSFDTIQVSSTGERFLLELVDTATRKYAEGHEIIQVVDNTIWTNGTEFRTGVVLFATEKEHHNENLMYKLEYSSRFDSSIDFYTKVEKTLNDLCSSHHKIHCISIDSYPMKKYICFVYAVVLFDIIHP